MFRYRVLLESKDGQSYEYTTTADCEETAIKFALDSINSKGWDCYEYKVKDVTCETLQSNS